MTIYGINDYKVRQLLFTNKCNNVQIDDNNMIVYLFCHLLLARAYKFYLDLHTLNYNITSDIKNLVIDSILGIVSIRVRNIIIYV